MMFFRRISNTIVIPRITSRYASTHPTIPKLLDFKTPEGYVQPEPSPEDEIIISMSSGVDSSVTALMYSLKYPKQTRGIFMSNWSSDTVMKDSNSRCTIEKDWEQVQETCLQLGIPCERVNFEKEYWNDVFQPMLEMYQRGLTPNPDIGCNKYVKFGKMIHHLENYYKTRETSSEKNKNWWLVTGHYSKVLKHEASGEHHLFRSDYMPKDQSYYLSMIPEPAMSRILMPIGHYTKPQIREIAHKYDLITKDKRDSQGLCFVSQVGKFKDLLSEYLEPNPGNIITKDGKVWGQHSGLWSGTIGQKSGISMPQGDSKYKGVWFISDKNIKTNELLISRKDDKEAFLRDVVIVEQWEWLNKNLKLKDLKISENQGGFVVQFRSLQQPNGLKDVEITEDGLMKFILTEKIEGTAPGQYLVLYTKEGRVLGSGVISAIKNSTTNSTV